MLMSNSCTDSVLIQQLNSGRLAIVRTDTVYGIVASAELEAAVEEVFRIKQRDTDKPLIVLVPSIDGIPGLSKKARSTYVEYSAKQPTSIIVPATTQPKWLTRDIGSVAYRVPSNAELIKLLEAVGPLVAPSANPQALPVARNIDEAIAYFGEDIDTYIDGGTVDENTLPSRLIRLNGDDIQILR